MKPSTPKSGELASVKIRRARAGDIPRLAELTTQLGYPSTKAEIAERMKKLGPASLNALLVAESKQEGVIGWTHVSVTHLLEVGTRAEVNGLVIAEGRRSAGAGTLLLDAAEEWARKHGCPAMSVRSNVLRERAHKFYERRGYEHYKTQKAFRKPL